MISLEHMEYRAAQRGMLLLWYLAHAGRHGLAAVYLARRLGVSRRHAYRLLRDASEIEIPVYNDHGRWFLLSKADGAPTDL